MSCPPVGVLMNTALQKPKSSITCEVSRYCILALQGSIATFENSNGKHNANSRTNGHDYYIGFITYNSHHRYAQQRLNILHHIK